MQSVTKRGGSPAQDLVTDLDYDGFGDLVRTTLPKGTVIEYEYDDVGRLISVSRGPAPSTPIERMALTLDAVGNITREEHQRWEGAGWVLRASTDFVYSSRCRLDKIVYPDGSATEYGYDCNGNRERIWDANHPSVGQTDPATSSHAYDELNRLVSVSQPWAGTSGGQATTRYAYDVQDHLVRATDAEGNVTSYAYSDRDLLTEQLSEISGRTTFGYNEHGQLIRRTDPRQITVHWALDALDRVLFVDYPENALDTTYIYDDPTVAFSNGRLSAVLRDTAAVEYEYDRFGRPIRDGSLTFGYDDNSNRITLGYPDGVTATYTYDFADRPESLTLDTVSDPPQAIVSGAEYLPSGPLSKLDLGNGLIEIREFSQRYFPRGIAVTGRLDWDYSTDALGNVLAITDTLQGDSRSFDYQDYHYFLTRGDGPWGELSWTYDKIGNRLTETRDGTTGFYRYRTNEAGGRNPKLAEVRADPADGVTSYFYDAAGNQTFQAAEDRKLRLSYNDQGRLAQLMLDSPATTGTLTRFTYDGRNLLNRSELTPFLGRPASTTTTPTYSSDGRLFHRRIDEDASSQPPRNEGRTTTDSFVLYFSRRPTAIFDRIEQTDNQGQTTEGSRLRFLTTDHLGSPALSTDGAAVAVWKTEFQPFGYDSGPTEEATPFLRLPGQWQDPTWAPADLYYNVFRWFDPVVGRYPVPDPFWDPQRLVDINPFGYAGQNPTTLTDPRGLATWECEYLYGNVGLPPGSPVTGGVTGLRLVCQSECYAGKRVSVNSRALFGGGSLGILPFGLTIGNITLTDPEPRPSGAAFQGFAVLGGFGLSTPVPAGGCLSLNIGATTNGLGSCGSQTGVDLGVDVYFGWGFLTKASEECCSNDPGDSN